LITTTYALIGPEVADASHRYSGNNLACESCHLVAGTKKFGLPFQGVFADFPNYRARSGAVGTIEGRINGCMTRSMNGRALPLDSPQMTAIVAYLKFLSTGRPVGAPTPGRGPGRMAEMTRAADPMRGKAIYGQTCAACHGENGQGERTGRIGDGGGYSVPPPWGDDSFNDGAGMDRLISAANFIHNNMPVGTTWQQPVLSVEDSWDVAAFVLSQPPSHVRLYKAPTVSLTFGSRITRKRQRCMLPPLGAQTPASRIFRISSFGTGSGFSRRIDRVVRRIPNRSAAFANSSDMTSPPACWHRPILATKLNSDGAAQR
jgi:cytochrome c